MRELKFRAWDEENEEMVYDVGITPEGIAYTIPEHAENFDQFDYYPEAHIMQYTGLKDKNGKEIYEGDIVKLEVAPEQFETRIITHSLTHSKKTELDHFLSAFFYTESKGIHEAICWYNRPFDFAEVIGNIYETPELLERT